MKKNLLIGLFVFLSLANTSFACGCKGSTNLSNYIYQKACQNVLSLINLDLSLLSPRASISDLDVAGPKTTCCSKTQSISTDEDKQKEDKPACNEKKSMATDDGQEKIIPVANKQVLNQSCAKPQSKVSLFRVDLFRIFKMQIL